MRIEIITLFPEIINTINFSIIKKSIDKGFISIRTHQLRNYSELKQSIVDDKPYGGIDGMLLRPEPIDKAVQALTSTDQIQKNKTAVVIPAANGYQLNQKYLEQLSQYKKLIFINSRYSGIDARVPLHIEQCLQIRVFELSIGPYILLDGDIPSLVIIDGVIRLVKGILNNNISNQEDSFSEGIVGRYLEYPCYTRPFQWHQHSIPEVLKSGHFQEIEKWKRQASIERTLKYRPELFTQIRKKATDF